VGVRCTSGWRSLPAYRSKCVRAFAR
jgi:hypothetical protein